MADLVRLDQRERLEQLVERAEAAGEDHEAARVAHEHHLAREEVVELEAEVQYGFRPCSKGSSMFSPIDGAPASRAPRLAASMSPGPPPVMIASRLAEQARGLARGRVLRVVALNARRAEERHRRAHVGQRVEARSQLPRSARCGPRP